MNSKESVMKMTQEEINHHYNVLFEKSSVNQNFSAPKHEGQIFKKASILEDTRISYSTSTQV